MGFFFYLDPAVLQAFAGTFTSLLIEIAATVIGGILLHKLFPPTK